MNDRDLEEVAVLRRYRRELEAKGFRVLDVYMSEEGPRARVDLRESPGAERVIAAARLLLDAVGDVDVRHVFSARDYETLAAAERTLRTVLDRGVFLRDAESLGDAARLDAAHALRNLTRVKSG